MSDLLACKKIMEQKGFSDERYNRTKTLRHSANSVRKKSLKIIKQTE
jgi:hypothetical protein